MTVKILTTTFKLSEGVCLKVVVEVKQYHDDRGQVIHERAINRKVEGEGIPEEMLKEVAEWWRSGFPDPRPANIEQYLHSLSAGHLFNF